MSGGGRRRTGRGISVLELLRAFEAASGQRIPYEVVARRAGDVAQVYADPTLAHRLLGWKANKSLNLLVLDVLAIVCGLNAVLDLLALMRFSDLSNGDIMNDAAAFSQQIAPIFPGAVWAFIWAILAVLMLGAAVWYSLVRPVRKSLV